MWSTIPLYSKLQPHWPKKSAHYRSDESLRREKHVGARVPIEHELPFTVRSESDECQGGSCSRVEESSLVGDAVLRQNSSEHEAELVVSEFSDEGGVASEPSDGNGDVRRGGDDGTKSISILPKHTTSPPLWCPPLLSRKGEREREEV